jgi:hypothetical protein
MKTEKTGKTKKVHAEARRRRGIEVVHDAVQPFLEGGGAKINQ